MARQRMARARLHRHAAVPLGPAGAWPRAAAKDERRAHPCGRPHQLHLRPSRRDGAAGGDAGPATRVIAPRRHALPLSIWYRLRVTWARAPGRPRRRAAPRCPRALCVDSRGGVLAVRRPIPSKTGLTSRKTK
eukprot:552407-Prymnesium_polylepis.1